MKTKQLLLTVGQKQELCKYKATNPSALTKDIATHFGSLWSLSISPSTIGDILRSSDKWLAAPDTDLKYLNDEKTRKSEVNRTSTNVSTSIETHVPVSENRKITSCEAKDGILLAISYLEANPPVVEEFITMLHTILKHIENSSIGIPVPVPVDEPDVAEQVLISSDNTGEVINGNQYFIVINGQLVEYTPANESCETVSLVENDQDGSQFQVYSDGDINGKMLSTVAIKTETGETIVEMDQTEYVTHNTDQEILISPPVSTNKQSNQTLSNKGDEFNAEMDSDNETEVIQQDVIEQGVSQDHTLKTEVLEETFDIEVITVETSDEPMKNEAEDTKYDEPHVHFEHPVMTVDETVEPVEKKKRIPSMVNNVLRPHLCSQCNRRFKTLEELQEHERKHPDPSKKKHQCDVCGKTFHRMDNFKNHRRVHTGERPFKCEECGKCFTDPSSLRCHRTIHEDTKSFLCKTCGKAFAQKHGLDIHEATHTGERPFACDLCDKHFRQLAALRAHTVIHTGEKPWICGLCGKAFRMKGALVIHANVHKPDGEKRRRQKPETKEFHCTQCQKSFYFRADLKDHARYVHNSTRPHVCRICSKRFALASKLKLHSRTHTTVKKHICNLCHKSFKNSNFLSKHQAVHTGERPCVCNICGAAFSLGSNLTTHKRRKHTANDAYPFGCTDCEKSFKDKESMLYHAKIMH